MNGNGDVKTHALTYGHPTALHLQEISFNDVPPDFEKVCYTSNIAGTVDYMIA